MTLNTIIGQYLKAHTPELKDTCEDNPHFYRLLKRIAQIGVCDASETIYPSAQACALQTTHYWLNMFILWRINPARLDELYTLVEGYLREHFPQLDFEDIELDDVTTMNEKWEGSIWPTL